MHLVPPLARALSYFFFYLSLYSYICFYHGAPFVEASIKNTENKYYGDNFSVGGFASTLERSLLFSIRFENGTIYFYILVPMAAVQTNAVQ